MTACPATLGNHPDGLHCTRVDVHTTHVYESTAGVERDEVGEE